MCKDTVKPIEKQLKVTRQPQGKKYVPGFRLAGNYMESLGFKEGDHVDMVANQDVIILKKHSEQLPKLSEMVNKNPALLSLISAFELVPDEGV